MANSAEPEGKQAKPNQIPFSATHNVYSVDKRTTIYYV